MKILALESSGLVASAAVVSEEKVIGEFSTNFKKTHSQTLLPMADAVLKMTDIDIREIDAIAVSGGPGSFTGLRIGSATAKGLGLALRKPIISVPTLEALAWNIFGTEGLICPIMDARRNQVYTAVFEYQESRLVNVSPQEAVPIETIVGKLNHFGRKVVFLGDGVPVFRGKIAEMIRVPYQFAPVNLCVQRAGTLGAAAIQYYREGRIESAAQHHPDYLRPSQAERERAERLKGGRD